MGKQEEKAARSKQKLIDAASKLFSEREIADVGIREICAEAGVTTGTYYHYYKTKTDIVNAIYDTHDSSFGEILKAYAAEPPYAEKIVKFFAEDLAPNVEADGIDFTLHRMFGMRKHSDERHELYKGMIRLIECAKENGEILEKYDTYQTNNYLFMVFRGAVYDWCIMPDEERDPLPRLMKAAMKCAVRSFTV